MKTADSNHLNIEGFKVGFGESDEIDLSDLMLELSLLRYQYLSDRKTEWIGSCRDQKPQKDH